MTAEVVALVVPFARRVRSWRELQAALAPCGRCIDSSMAQVSLEGSRVLALHAHNGAEEPELMEVAWLQLSPQTLELLGRMEEAWSYYGHALPPGARTTLLATLFDYEMFRARSGPVGGGR